MWNYDIFNEAITDWLLEELDKMGIQERKYTQFAKNIKLSEKDPARTFRLIRAGKQKWTIENICNLANYLDEHLSHIFAKVEVYYKINRNDLFIKIQARKIEKEAA